MAKKEHLAILKNGFSAWNEWRKQESKDRPDLSNADFSRAKLSRADLSGAKLFGADLRNADLSGAKTPFPACPKTSGRKGRAQYKGCARKLNG